MAWRFPVWYSFSVDLCKFMCFSAFRPSSSPSNSLVVSSRLFCYVFWLTYFFSKIVRFPLNPVVGSFSRHLLPVVGRIFFRCFGMSCFVCIVLPFVDIFLIFLLSPVISGLFPQVVQLFFLMLLFLFVPTYSDVFLLFHHLACFRRFFYLLSSRIFHPGFDFFFVLFEWIPISSKTNFAPA